MQYGLCNLSIVPLRREPSDASEMISQVLYGEFFKILEGRKHYVRIRLFDDGCEGWIDRKQYLEIAEEYYKRLVDEEAVLTSDLISYLYTTNNSQLTCIPIGSRLNSIEQLSQQHDGERTSGGKNRKQLIATALMYLNSPCIWGGKSPFGIDCSGFTQMVYKLNGHKLLREAELQATQGVPLSFIEESEEGDLAFFDNNEGEIIHVGIIMKDNYIIHAHGKVRIDRIDHSGIYNAEEKRHTHKLRVIKKII